MAKRYEKYKDSGIAWIGEIPEHWIVFPIKHLCKYEKYSIKTGPFGTQLKGDDLQESGDVIVYNQKNVIYQHFDEVRFYISYQKADKLKSFYTRPNDFLITSRGTIGRAAILPNIVEMGILHPCLIALRLNKEKVLDKWLLYFVNDTDCFKTGIQLASNATTIEVIYTETLKNSLVAIPSTAEQEQIVKYLDWKCREIDRIIEVRKQQIKLLGELRTSVISRAVTRGLNPNAPLKDSGIEWIEHIPEHWEVQKLSNFLNLLTDGAHLTPDYKTNGIPFLSIKDMSSGKLDFTNTKYIDIQTHNELSKRAPVKKGDILFSRIGTLGVFIKVDTDITFDIFVSLGLMKIAQDSIIIDYLLYFLSSNATLSYIEKVKAGGDTSAAKFNLGDVKKTPILFPPKEEQQQIANYLDRKTVEIDSTIDKFKVQIDKLKEYKQALITEVVTGKIDVRGIEIPALKSN